MLGWLFIESIGINGFWRSDRSLSNRSNSSQFNERTVINIFENHIRNDQQRTEHTFREIRPMGFRRMEELLKTDHIEDLIFELTNERKGFSKLLEKTDLSNDHIVLAVKLLHKICDSSFSTNVTSLLEKSLIGTFSETIVAYISRIPMQDERIKKTNKYFWNEPDEFWTNILKISHKLHTLIPKRSCGVIKKLLNSIKIYVPIVELCHAIRVSVEVKENINKLDTLIEEYLKEIKAEKVKLGILEDEGPPDDFRDINIYPSVEEITTKKEPFLRCNIIDKPYDTIYQYLDVQFRLLREDFVRPLRMGICKFLSDNKAKLDDIRIYKEVQFLNAEVVNDQNCYRVQFEAVNKKRKYNYNCSRRFMYGSLLCFTSNNFKTIIFGKIVQRNTKDLEKGQLIVGFDNDIVLPDYLYDVPFLMVESSVYFEPYYHVLNVLKYMEPINFPMERYIIRVETDPRPPGYLLQDDPLPYEIENQRFKPLEWGDREFYGLNESQQAAFKAALTQEFAVIQGPPGTGKTFLGLKIARSLIENQSFWYKDSPILVICYTNHALDQFLEGILEITDNICRIGGQSKNENLKTYNLRNLHKSSNGSICQLRRDVHSNIVEINVINEILALIENNDSVLDFCMFSKDIKDYRSSFFSTAKSTEIYKWLFSGYQGQNNDTYQLNDRQKSLVSQYEETKSELKISDAQIIEDNNDDVLYDEIFDYVSRKPFKSLINIECLKRQISDKENELNRLINDTKIDEREKRYHEYLLINNLEKIQFDLNYLQMRLQEYAMVGYRKPQFIDLKNPYNMDPDSRWQLYFYWLNIYINNLRRKKERITNTFKRIYKVYSEMRDMENVQTMRQALVIGMTTTGAARLHASLQALKSPIVIVEEAAEVLEAHIISSLTAHCKHLILIGDHQQLKPSTANFKIETKYLLGISLFERMVINKIQCHTLNIQHRMRPEISSLIHPVIYPELYDHESVMDRPPIRGVEKCLYFIDHQEPEELCSDNSKKNIHEAKFLIKLARHLVLNDYKPENIVILVAYLGQMFEMQHLKKKEEIISNVRIAVLDNYQGEESDIILLSLVRNNPEKKIGFLNIENRVCVALSRARNGLYIMGNMEQLCESREIWSKIRDVLKQQDAVGSYLSLRCQVHRSKITPVKDPDDFIKFPEGGCDSFCNEMANCGHLCKMLCHGYDRNHINYKCMEKCTKILCEDTSHVCHRICYQECGPCTYPVEKTLDCGHTATIQCSINPSEHKCNVLIEAILPCGHEVNKPCHADSETFQCTYPCENRVESCGHACVLSCHIRNDPDHVEYKCFKDCERPRKGCTLTDDKHLCRRACYEDCEQCDFIVKKKRTDCPHMYNIPCKVNVDDIECKKPCTKMLPCGHKCKRHCCDPCGNCKGMVEKIVPECNHKIKMKCRDEPTRNVCFKKCPRLLPCGHVCDKKCAEVCTSECTVIMECSIRGPCGHIVKRAPCFLKSTDEAEKLVQYCNEKCEVQLQCGHKCSGTCGECSQGRIHKRCMENCKVPLICNHECPIPCRQACQPCKKKCSYRCGHSNCPKKCGDPCVKCTEKCKRKCRHIECTKKCWEICNVPPCDKPCRRFLKCGHKCVGFCGEICPKLCRICDKKELTEIFFGTEDEKNAIYVMLEDCRHVFESKSLDQYFSQKEDEIKPKVCPKCKTTVRNSRRYSKYIKLMLKDFTDVKTITYGETRNNEQTRLSLIAEIRSCYSTYKIDGLSVIHKMLKTLENRLRLSKRRTNEPIRRQEVNKMNLNAIKAKIQVIQTVCNNIKTVLPITDEDKIAVEIVNLIFQTLFREIDTITGQELADIYNEMNRLTRSIQLQQIKRKVNFKDFSGTSDVQMKVVKIESLLQTKQYYTTDLDNTLKTELEELNELTKSKINITEAECKEIRAALNLEPGRWFKCANGHLFIITECGGAMEVGKCNECGAPIGGHRHQLLHGTFAPEMDGARYPAWSEMANMANYDF